MHRRKARTCDECHARIRFGDGEEMEVTMKEGGVWRITRRTVFCPACAARARETAIRIFGNPDFADAR